ncbi:alpha/beta fold hydrolase [Sphingobium boeckii]|uniref:Pimeloyl-ACP methyl ester carboxylesterase n=1 Tax=Sphingobium boeckii TaxID=1082345 RepID=A0A7W9AHW9_9SPHN|nr:alpha/beta fold hydrolase [Sphingobium boeckii]MBB5685827.1 pimeloyl-ACP methyl ester carboxylesterase [Sphingobium boeckii]
MERVGDTIEVEVFGELALVRAGAPLALPASRKTRALFVYLLLHGKAVRRDRLCELFFDLPDDPRAALRWSLTKIRTMLGPDSALLVADRERVALHAAGFTIARLDAARALEAPLPGLDLSGLDDYALWLRAERMALDHRRAAWLATAAVDPAQPEAVRLRLSAARDGLVDATDPAPSPPPKHQDVHYCRAPDGVRIAYSVTGAGPMLVKTANWLNHLELDWGSPLWGRMVEGLSEHFRLVRYDERGNGLSDWEIGPLTFESLVTDLETVVDALGLERFPLFGLSQGCAVSIEYAARHPHRVSHLILLGGYSTGWRHRLDAGDAAEREAIITLVKHGWGKDSPAYRQIFSQSFTPSATPAELDWFNDFQRRTVSPANAAAFLDLFGDIDVRHRLTALDVPTLVLHARGDQRIGIDQAMELAASIRGASLVTLDTDNHILRSHEPAMELVIERIRAFLA